MEAYIGRCRITGRLNDTLLRQVDPNHPMGSVVLMDRVKARLDWSDHDIADALGVHPSAVSRYRLTAVPARHIPVLRNLEGMNPEEAVPSRRVRWQQQQPQRTPRKAWLIDASLADDRTSQRAHSLPPVSSGVRPQARVQVKIEGIIERDGPGCFYCGCDFSTTISSRRMTLDQRVPAAAGGTNRTENLRLVCMKCSNKKAALPEEAFLALPWLTRRRGQIKGERTQAAMRRQSSRLADTVAELLGRAVLPGRAKASRYFGDSSWHRDSSHDIASVGCVSYLEPVTADTGALRVIPGSHRRPDIDLPAAQPGEVGTAVDTQPGDVIVFDEHLIHGSRGGQVRHQWRIDFVVDPRDGAEVEATLAWYEQSLPTAEPEAGYDATLYTSWGAFWRSLERPWSNSLRRLGLNG